MLQRNILIKFGKDLGFEVQRTNGGHLKFKGYGAMLFTSSTSSDHRQTATMKKNLTKIAKGLVVARP